MLFNNSWKFELLTRWKVPPPWARIFKALWDRIKIYIKLEHDRWRPNFM